MTLRRGTASDDFNSLHALQTALDAGRIGTWTWDIPDDSISWSAGFEAAHGFPPGSLPRSLSAYQERIHPDDRARVVAALESCASGHDPYSVAYRLIDPAGKTHHVEAHGQAIRDQAGQILGMVGVCSDVSERRDILERFRLFIEHAPAAIAMFDRDMRYLAASRRWSSRYLLSNDIIGRSHYDLFPDLPDGWRAVHERALQGEVVKADDDRFARADGTTYWLRWEVRPWFSAPDEVGGIIVFSEDITERKLAEEAVREAENRFHVMADNSPVLIWQTDSSGGRFVNRYYLDFFGQPLEALIPMGWIQFLHPEDVGYLEAYQAAFERHERYEYVCRFRRHDGAYRWLHNIGTPHYGADGTFDGFIGCSFDVTERFELIERERQARLAAETTRAQYRTLAETIPQQVWTATPEGTLDFVNQRVAEYFGREFEELIGAGWQAVVHVNELGGVVERWTRSLMSGDEYEVEFRLRRFDGVYRWHLGRAIPVRDAEGAIVKWLGTNTDIDDQKTARNLMAAQGEIAELLVLARSLEEVAKPILKSVCSNLFWTCAQLWVVDRTSGVLRRVEGWCNPSMPGGDLDRLGETKVLQRGVGLPGRIWESGSPAWIEDLAADTNFPRAGVARYIGLYSAFGFPLIVGGEVSAVLELFSSDRRPANESTLTHAAALGALIGQFIERLTAEEHIRRLQSVTDVALAHLPLNELLDNLLGKICEAANCDIGLVLLLEADTNQMRPAAVCGATLKLAPDLRIAVGESFSGRVAAQRRTQIVHDIPHQAFIRAEIRELGLMTAMGVPLLAGDRLLGVLMLGSRQERYFAREEVLLAELVASRVALALENSALYEQSRAANKMKDRFLSIAAHDLRTPMTATLGWTRVLHMDVDDETRNEALASIEESVSAQARLIDDLLDSTRIREGKLVLNCEPIDLARLVISSITMVTPAAHERGVDLQASEMSEAIVFGDSTRLQQVVWNLLSNAIKFTPSGKQVRAFLRTDKTTVTIIVEDDGDGISAGFLPQIFQPFQQDDNGERAGGLGLGLHIVATVVKLHGGTIDAESAGLGKGARFTVKLPLASHAA